MSARVLVATDEEAGGAVVAQIVGALRAGEVVGIPTDTVYGLAVDPWQPGATDRLFAFKDRPRAVVLAVLVEGESQVSDLATSVGPSARRLMEVWWPGPLTIVLDRRPGLGADLGAPGPTVGVRCPDHAFVRALARSAGPIATTSANRHGEPPATTAASLVAAIGGLSVVVDGGPCARRPSTVVDCTGATVRVLRPGPIGEAEIRAAVRGRTDRRP